MKQWQYGVHLILIMAMIVFGGGCAPNGEGKPVENKQENHVQVQASPSPSKLQENRLIYKEDQPDSIVHFYLTITEDNATADPPMTWAELNRIAFVEQKSDNRKVNVILQEGTDQGPGAGMFGYGESQPNATAKVRGNSSIKAPQKSYKIDLFDHAGYWRNQQTINLVKHPYDFTRIRNKLSFDFFKKIPHFTSLRTQFVHLHVKDLTGGAKQTGYEDYGLYTQIEQPNKAFLRLHGLDPYGHLYKAVSFEYFRYADQLRVVDDPAYDEKKFETILEIKGWNDHTKLIRMLEDINDLNQDFDVVFDKHFDRDNFMTWMAVNILMDNVDTNSQNFYLYSPLNSEKWFVLPWDYDGAWGYYDGPLKSNRRAPWQRGIANYWGTTVVKRLFKNPKNVDELVAKVQELGTIITPEESKKMIDTYKPIVSPYVHRAPDSRFLPGPLDIYEKEIARIAQTPKDSEQKFIESLQRPMPFHLGDVEKANGKLIFRWDMSYDLQGDELTYHFQLAKDPSFSRPLIDRQNLTGTTLEVQEMGKGRFYWRVIVKDAKGNEMTAFDTFQDESDNFHHGVREFYVK